MRIARLPGVFPPHSDTWLLAAVLRRRPQLRGGTVLDVCTGSGAIAVAAALAGARSVTAVDLSLRAVLTTRLNARLNGVRVEALRGDLLDAVPGRRFDVIVSNPPYLPSEEERLPGRGAARHTEAGGSGRLVLDRLIDAAPAHLVPGGVLLVTHSSVNGESGDARPHARRGPGARRRGAAPGTARPAARGACAPARGQGHAGAGQRSEDVLVLSGTV